MNHVKATHDFTREDVDVLKTAADLLYLPEDPRYTPWPDRVTVGQIRHDLRTLADYLDDLRPSDHEDACVCESSGHCHVCTQRTPTNQETTE